MPVESVRFRQRRHALLLSLIDTLPRPLTILDVGGTVHYWRRYGVPRDVHITLLNRGPAPADLPPNFCYVQGDACAMQFADNEFDVVFSNSVIEHVGEWARQQAMAHEVQRVGHSIWVQTPSRWFPWEPHYDLPFFQFWPLGLRLAVARWKYRRRNRSGSVEYAEAECRNTRLLSANEMHRLFPAAQLYRERIGPLVKSYVAYSFENGG